MVSSAASSIPRPISSTAPRCQRCFRLMVTAFGDKGRHARTTVGVASYPRNAAVEVDAIFEVS